MQKMRKILPLLSLLLVCISLTGCKKEEDNKVEGEHKNHSLPAVSQYAELTLEELTLSINPQDGRVIVTDRRTGNVWESNPGVESEDPVASGENKTMIKSQAYITYTNAEWKEKKLNSYVGCINNGRLEVFALENGYRVEYHFGDVGIMVPVEYTIENRRLRVNVVLEDIEENGQNLLNTLSLLPFFGTASMEDEGILLIPDGSGAVIRMNNGKTSCQDYSKRYYGEDAAYPEAPYDLDTQKLLLPIFGMVRNQGAFLGRICEGAELATLQASIAGKNTSYNSLYTTVEYRGVDRESALKNDSNSGYAYLPDEPVESKCYTVEYIFSDQEQPGYADLVSIYRNELEAQLDMADSDEVTQDMLYVDMYGGITKKQAVLGIVYDGKLPVTKYSQAQALLEDLSQLCSQNISARLLHYSKGEFSKKAGASLEPMCFLGSAKEYRQLLSWCAENNIAFYPGADINSLRKGGNGFSVSKDTISDLTRQNVLTKNYDIAQGEQDFDGTSEYLLGVNALEKSALKTAKLMKQYELYGISLYADGLQLYSDFGKTCSGRDEIRAAYESAFDVLEENGKLSFEQPFEYMLPYASEAVGIPVGSGGHLLFDYDVPFYQMAVMGKVNYSANAYNMTNPTRDYFLACIESFTALRFVLGSDESELVGEADGQLHNIAYAEQKELIASYSKEMQELSEAVQGAILVDFERIGTLSIGTYDNGVKVYTNHEEHECQIHGTTIPAMDFVILGGDAS